jgi:hypothetical protein
MAKGITYGISLKGKLNEETGGNVISLEALKAFIYEVQDSIGTDDDPLIRLDWDSLTYSYEEN